MERMRREPCGRERGKKEKSRGKEKGDEPCGTEKRENGKKNHLN